MAGTTKNSNTPALLFGEAMAELMSFRRRYRGNEIGARLEGRKMDPSSAVRAQQKRGE